MQEFPKRPVYECMKAVELQSQPIYTNHAICTNLLRQHLFVLLLQRHHLPRSIITFLLLLLA